MLAPPGGGFQCARGEGRQDAPPANGEPVRRTVRRALPFAGGFGRTVWATRSLWRETSTRRDRSVSIPGGAYPNGEGTMRLKVVVHEAEEGGYWAEVPAIPGCAT